MLFTQGISVVSSLSQAPYKKKPTRDAASASGNNVEKRTPTPMHQKKSGAAGYRIIE